MRKICVFLVVLASGCKISSVGSAGMVPTISKVSRGDPGLPPTPRFCDEYDATLFIYGDGFVVRPTAVLSTTPGVEMPKVEIDGPELQALSNLRYDPAEKKLIAIVPEKMRVGVYDVIVTNPTGESARMVDVVEITDDCGDIDLCSYVTPFSGWIGQRNTIEICSDNTRGHGILPTPEIYLVIDPEHDEKDVKHVPLLRTVMTKVNEPLAGYRKASVVTAVVPAVGEDRGFDLQVGGPWDIRVINPNGTWGLIPRAYTVLPDSPPVITSISPEQTDRSRVDVNGKVTLRVRGEYLKDPSVSQDPRWARVLLLTMDLLPGAVCSQISGCYECGNPMGSGAGSLFSEVTCEVDLSLVPPGGFVVRYEHLSDGSHSDYSNFVIAHPDGALDASTQISSDYSGSSLNDARFRHGAVLVQDAKKQRFVYVVGGQSGSVNMADYSTALDTVEVAPLDRFGNLGRWSRLPLRLPAKRTDLAVVSYGQYVFALGGRDPTGVPQSDVYRAHVLDPNVVPVLDAPEGRTGGSLVSGTYLYRVSAVMGPGTNNDGGESLASEAETIRVSGDSSAVRLSWIPVSGAVSYRVFRSSGPDQLVGSERLLASGVTTTQYDDLGIRTVDEATKPLPDGATSVWMPMPPLTRPRAAFGAAVALDPNNRAFLYAVAGKSTGESILDTYDFARITLINGVVSSGAFMQGNEVLESGWPLNNSWARANHVVTALNDGVAPRLTGLGRQYVLVAQGRDNEPYADLVLGYVNTDGQIDLWRRVDSLPLHSDFDRYGATGILVNNFLYTIGGVHELDHPPPDYEYVFNCKIAEVCPTEIDCATTSPPSILWNTPTQACGLLLQEPRYRAATVYVGGYFYIIGGRTDDFSVLRDVERAKYAAWIQ